jgi:DNA-damage-inducible protein D
MYKHRDLALAAYRSGVLSGRDFLQILEFGYRGLYHETQQQIRECKGLKRGQDISDYMGSLETAANIFHAALAHQLMDDRGVTDLPRANATHHEAGDSVRAVLLSKGIVPEQLPTPRKSFQQLLREAEARQRILAEERLGLWGDAEETN